MIRRVFFAIFFCCAPAFGAIKLTTDLNLAGMYSAEENQIWVAVAASVWKDTYDGSLRYAVGSKTAQTEKDAVIGAFTQCANAEGRGCVVVGGRAINTGCIYILVVQQVTKLNIIFGRTQAELWSKYFMHQGDIVEKPNGYCVPEQLRARIKPRLYAIALLLDSISI